MVKKLPVIASILAIFLVFTIVSFLVLDSYDIVSILPKTVQCEFRNYDESILYTVEINKGTDVTYLGAEPSYEAQDASYKYVFKGWDKSLTNIQKDTIFYPVFDVDYQKYVVSFVNYDGTLLYEDVVLYGERATYEGETPEHPTDEYGVYTFDGWDKSFSRITSDLEVKATYTRQEVIHTVSFYALDTLLYRTYVGHHQEAEYKGATPSKMGDENYDYEFVGWNLAITDITTDLTVTAQFRAKPTQYVVRFYNADETLLYVDHVQENGKAEYYGAYPTLKTEGGVYHEFIGWDRGLEEVTSDLDIHAVYENRVNKLEVRFYNYFTETSSGELLYYTFVDRGESVEYPFANPTRPQDKAYVYEFDGWDRDLTNIQDNLVVYAIYNKLSLTCNCTFYNYDGTFLYYTTTEYGQGVSYLGETPFKPADDDSYRFVGWDHDTNVVRGDTEFHAVFEATGGPGKAVTYWFHDYDGKVLDACEIHKGELANFSYDYPQRSGYVFIGWSELLTFAKYDGIDNVDVYALYLFDGNPVVACYTPYGQLIGEVVIEYGSEYEPSYDYEFLRPENGFIGWKKSRDVEGAYCLIAEYSELNYSKQDFLDMLGE